MGSHSAKKPSLLADLKAVDSRFSDAGLVRSRRGNAAVNPRNAHFERADPEDLARPAPVPNRAPNGVEWLAVPGWYDSWLWSGFSTRKGGVSRVYCAEGAPGELNLGFTEVDDRNAVVSNRRLLAEAVTGDAETPLVALRQFHSNLSVETARSDVARERPRKADGQITNQPGFLLAIQTADCVPVLVADRRLRAVAAFHAGWRGTVKRIVELGVGRMRLVYGSRPQDLVAAIGPGSRSLLLRRRRRSPVRV